MNFWADGVEQTNRCERAYTVSRSLEERIHLRDRSGRRRMSNAVVAQLRCPEADNPKKEMSMYIPRPAAWGQRGSRSTTPCIHSSGVSTLSLGQPASMGSLLFAAGPQDGAFAAEFVASCAPAVGPVSRAGHLHHAACCRDPEPQTLKRITVKHTARPIRRSMMRERDKFFDANGPRLRYVDKVSYKRPENRR